MNDWIKAIWKAFGEPLVAVLLLIGIATIAVPIILIVIVGVGAALFWIIGFVLIGTFGTIEDKTNEHLIQFGCMISLFLLIVLYVFFFVWMLCGCCIDQVKLAKKEIDLEKQVKISKREL